MTPNQRNQPPRLEPVDIVDLAAAILPVARDAPSEAFDAPVAGTDWTARRTIDHIADALLLYAAYVATRASDRIQPIRDGRPNATVAELAGDIAHSAAILARLLDQMTDEERAFHPAGFADRTGWIGMACNELLVHGLETAGAIGAPFRPEDPLIESVVTRLFPWTPTGGTPLQRLLWANGRASLGPHPRLDSLWYWWCRPLAEWGGTPHRRTAPPAW